MKLFFWFNVVIFIIRLINYAFFIRKFSNVIDV